MTTLDWLIAAATAVFAASGFFRGFVVGALSLIGFAVGAFIGTRVADALLSGGAASPYAPMFGLLGALIAGGVLATGFQGVGLRLRRAVRLHALGLIDGVFGAVLSAAVALGIAWVLGTAALQLPAAVGLRTEVESSAILRHLDELLPPSGALLHALARVDPLPSLGSATAAIDAPPVGVAESAAQRTANGSVVRVIGDACGIGLEGSGWVIAPDEVLTNAHVVAGETDTTIEVGGDLPDLPARAVLFDVHNDLAILRVAGLALAPLTLAASAPAGTAGLIAGYPLDGPFDLESARLGITASVLTQNAYERGPVTRLLTPIRGLIRPGNSGGPVLDAAGQVLATVFAATTGGGPAGGFGVANATVRSDLASVRGPVSTESCVG